MPLASSPAQSSSLWPASVQSMQILHATLQRHADSQGRMWAMQLHCRHSRMDRPTPEGCHQDQADQLATETGQNNGCQTSTSLERQGRRVDRQEQRFGGCTPEAWYVHVLFSIRSATSKVCQMSTTSSSSMPATSASPSTSIVASHH